MSSIDESAFADDELGRSALLKAAQGLVQRLERPYERMMRMVWTEPILMIAVKIACDLDLFSHLSNGSKTTEQLAIGTGADALLIRRVLRLLGTSGIVEEVGLDTYAKNDFSTALADPNGIRNGIEHFYHKCIVQLEKLPAYFQENGYRNPSDAEHPPWEYISGSSSLWEWYKGNPKEGAVFNSFLASIRVGQPPCWSYYSVSSRLLADFDTSKPLVVDVGGGKGRDLTSLVAFLPPEYKDATLILQDLPSVISSVQKQDLPAQITTVAHDFFASQPSSSQGAKAYFLHSVLHDWPDEPAVGILQQLKDALRPGYSKILLCDTIMPDRVADVRPIAAAMDLNMMSHFAALERTEKQWRALLERAGLRWVGVWQTKGLGQGVIEVEV